MTLVGCDHGHESCARCIAKLMRLEVENERLRVALRSLIQQVEFVRDAYWPLSEPCDLKLVLQAIHAWAETAAAFARTDLDRENANSGDLETMGEK